MTNSSSTSHCESGCDSKLCLTIGIIIHLVGSIGINIGQNLQAMGMEQLGASKNKPWKNRLWVIGMAIFAVSSVVTFGALALASASVLVPLESVQFIVNIIFAKVVRKKTITKGMYAGTLMIILGVCLIVFFGTQETYCFDEDQLIALYTHATFWVYCGLSFGIAGVLYVTWRRYRAALMSGAPMWRSQLIEPVAFALSSALFGGGQMIVHTKLLAELFEMSGDSLFISKWFFWLELVLTIGFGGYWLFRLSQCLAYYEPLFIIPLMQTAFIIFGAVAGGIFFQEFHDVHKGHAGAGAWPLYLLGIAMCVGGLFMLAPGGTSYEEGPNGPKKPSVV